MDQRLYWLGFAVCSGIGPGRFGKLITYFGSAKLAWHADIRELQQSGIGNVMAEQFVDFRKKHDLEGYEALLTKHQVSFVTLEDAAYPSLLRKIKNPPFVLFKRGNFDFSTVENQQAIGIVGTRNITEYGKQVTEQFTRELVSANCVVISGLALGVDALAHWTTLATGGKTVAVLGCGVDCCYPRENQSLYNSILEKGGAIVSEYALGVLPSKGSFPSRNRIIAGLSQGVLVTEGATQSGSLITAQDAFANQRKVFAIPGTIHSHLSAGPAKLIKQGAQLVTTPKEILDALHVKNNSLGAVRKSAIKGDTKEEQLIIDLLQKEQMHFDALVKQTQINSSQMGGILSLLEMKGIVTALDAGFFCLTDLLS